MVQLLAPIEALYQKVQASPAERAAAAEIDQTLPLCLDEALHLVAAYIRSHSAEFAQAEA